MKKITIFVCLILLVVLFTPIAISYRQSCPKCPKEGSIKWNQPLIFYLYHRVIRNIDPLEDNQMDIDELTKEQAIALVKKKYPEVKNIVETPNETIGKSMDIYTKQEKDSWMILFWQGSGDCPSGCLNGHEWYFIVSKSGGVQKAGEFERIFNSGKNGYDEKGMRIPNFL